MAATVLSLMAPQITRRFVDDAIGGVVLDRGRVAGRGSLDELLSGCPEMRRLWSEELIVEAEEQADSATLGS